MNKDLPFLNNERLDMIFEHVYGNVEGVDEQKFNEEKLYALLVTLKSMQLFNRMHRYDDIYELFCLLDRIFNFERNSEATTFSLSLMLAIKELYGFSDNKMVAIMKDYNVIGRGN